MDDAIGETMTEEEIASLLSTQGHGVLSLARDDRGYGIPIAYAYDVDADRIVLEFINIGESKKQTFVEAAAEVTLTVHNFEDQTAWESVIVTGALEPLDPEEVSDRSAARFFSQADDVAPELRWVESEAVERRWYQLQPSEKTGRHGGRMPHRESDGLVKFSGYDRTY